MATATKICKVCGCQYEYCRTQRTVAGVFRWQDVACCPEHGAEYLTAVMKARGEIVEDVHADTAATKKAAKRSTRNQTPEEASPASSEIKEESEEK